MLFKSNNSTRDFIKEALIILKSHSSLVKKTNLQLNKKRALLYLEECSFQPNKKTINYIFQIVLYVLLLLNRGASYIIQKKFC